MNLRKKVAGAVAAGVMLLSLHPCAIAQPVPDQIHALSIRAAQAASSGAGPYDERAWLQRFYAPRAYAPAWKPAQAEAALALLSQAAADGLDPREYGIDALARQLHGPAPDPARLDAELTAAMLHYLADLHVGRVRSGYFADAPDPRVQAYDPVEQLRRALAANRIEATVRAAAPSIPLYGRIKQALSQYRALAALPYAPLPQPDRKLKPGEPYAGAQALFEALVLLGDLPAATPEPKGTYSDELAEGVARFQARYGLDEDGVLGRGTIAALNVPLTRRVRQLELALERLRWLPDFGRSPVIAVDLPAYRLWAFRTGSAEDPIEMRVVVGQAAKTETPLFIGQMRYLEFNPYWNVPRSITEKEIIPKLEHNPRYLQQNDMELVPAGSTLDDLRAGRARVRQRPGPKNALGPVKFAMPNPMDIYLHSTSSRELFQRSRRDLSHGCIRVEHPAALIQFVLANQPQWDADEIQSALQPGPTRRVSLKGTVPVVLFYATAVADTDGKARFAPDIYQRDPALEQALAAHGSEIVGVASGLTE